MLIESWVLAMICVGIFIFGFIGIVGWILEGEKNKKLSKENKILWKDNVMLSKMLAHRNALDNIKEANDYYNKED